MFGLLLDTTNSERLRNKGQHSSTLTFKSIYRINVLASQVEVSYSESPAAIREHG